MQVVVRALTVLRALAGKRKGAGLQELHEELGIPVGSVHRVLSVLLQEEFITRSPTNKRYFLGPAARQLAEQAPYQTALLATPHPALLTAAHTSGETVFLTELIGDRAVCVGLAQGRHLLRLFVRIGQEMPLHAAASGRALLAYLPPHAARRLLQTHPLEPFTPDTPTTTDDVLDHLALIRARGHDVCDDELDRGVWAVSAPVFSSTGAIAASVTLAAAATRMRDPLTRATATATVLTTAQHLNAELGFTNNPPEPTNETPQEKPATESAVHHEPR